MNTIQIDTAHLSNDAERVAELIGQIPKMLDEIKTARATLSASWEGSAHDMYNNMMVSYENQLQKIYEIMFRFAQNMDLGAGKYYRVEQEVLQEINSIF